MMTLPNRIDPQKFLEANRDYISRAERIGVDLIYDATLDTLFIEFGGPRPAVNEHLVDNIMLRIDPASLEIVGCEIIDFFDDFVPNHRLVGGLLGDLAGLKEGQGVRLTLVEPQAKAVRAFVINAAGQLLGEVGLTG
jgi:hypothetical protein